MKKLLILLLVFVGCNENSMENNQILIAEIDRMPFTKCWLAFEIDSLGNAVDSVIIQQKFVDDEHLVFEVKNSNDFLRQTYLWEDRTDFYSILESKKSDFCEQGEVFRYTNGELVEQLMVSQSNNSVDSSWLKYDYDYSVFGNKKRLTISFYSAEVDGFHVLNYNSNEHVSSEATIFEGDTFEYKNYFYVDTTLLKINIMKTSPDTFLITKYFSPGKHDSTLVFKIGKGEKKITSRTLFQYSDDNQYVGYEEFDFETQEKKVLIRKAIECNTIDD